MCLFQASKSRRHRQVEVDFTSNEAGPSNSSGSSRISKPSLKVRTNENVHISGKSLLQLKYQKMLQNTYKVHTEEEEHFTSVASVFVYTVAACYLF